MAKFYDTLSDDLCEWIQQQKIFFVATAPLSDSGRINLSPKGYDCLRILDNNTVAYLDLTGSGNETSAHIKENGRITMMWCAYEGPANILRCYGRGEVAVAGSERWYELIPHFEMITGARQIIINHMQQVQTSCGFAVPFFDYKGEREALIKWAQHKGEDGLESYHTEKNAQSIDGLPTPLADTIAE